MVILRNFADVFLPGKWVIFWSLSFFLKRVFVYRRKLAREFAKICPSPITGVPYLEWQRQARICPSPTGRWRLSGRSLVNLLDAFPVDFTRFDISFIFGFVFRRVLHKSLNRSVRRSVGPLVGSSDFTRVTVPAHSHTCVVYTASFSTEFNITWDKPLHCSNS